MFVSLPSRDKAAVRWATPLLFAALWLAFLWSATRPQEAHGNLLMDWGALSDGLDTPLNWANSLRDGSALRLFTALFLHADWAHLLGNLVFLLIFGLPAERTMGPWRFLVLFLLGVTVNYITRNSLGILAPELKESLGITTEQYSWIVGAFQIAYTIFQPLCGWLIDVIGLKIGFMVCAGIWALMCIFHAGAGSWLHLAILRFFMGASEAAATPANAKTIGEWFPKSERPVAAGWAGVGFSIGAMLAPRLPFATVSARLALIYGPGQSTRFLVPSLIRRLMAGHPVHVARPTDRRDLMHVDDAVEGLIAVARTPASPIVNLCTGQGPTMRAVAEGIAAELEAPSGLLSFGPADPPGGTPVLIGAPDVAARGCGWRAAIPLAEGLARTIAAERQAAGAEALAC